jgi:eukaryotic-like serine/threonine-protein kinase
VEPVHTLIQDRIRLRDERSERRGETLLGRYRLLERLGAGGFGVVWRARDELLDREVALKRIALPSEEDRERAMREALATARLAHPAIVALYEACADDDAFYLISELVDGQTLEQLIAKDALSYEEILEIGAALSDALRHAHGRGVIHRDVKPNNVLVPAEQGSTSTRALPGRAAKLADFGGARLAGEEALTRAGDVLGTLAYMAPEQSEGLEAGVEADLYSLALVLYEALSGDNPVRGRTPAATAKRIGSPIEPLERRRRDLPRELTRAIDAALHPDPARRGTLAELQESLDAAFDRGARRKLLSRRRAPGVASRERVFAAPPGWTDGEASPLQERHPFRPASREWGAAVDQGERLSIAERLPMGERPPIGEQPQRRNRSRRIALPRLAWVGCVAALAIWQAAAGRGGVALLLLAAGAPLALLPRRAGLGWLLAALAPVLGLAGLASAFPAVAGQRSSARARAGLAALGFWWLTLAEPLLARRLWEGPPAGLPARTVWEGSLSSTLTHVLSPTFTVGLAIGAAVWVAASVILPWVVRGRNAALDVVAAVAWMVALLAAPALLEGALTAHPLGASPHGAVLGAAFGCAVAICARALRGPV